MKKSAVLLALVMATGAGLAKAAELESLRNSTDLSLESIQNSLDTLVKDFHGGPSFGGPGHNPGHGGHNPPPPPNHGGWNPGHNPGHNPGWNPGHGGHYPPPPPPNHGGWNPGHNPGHGGHYPPPPPPPQPWHPGPGYPGPYPHPQPWHPGPGYPGPYPHPQPWHPNPGPFPPLPVPHYQQVRFDSDRFMWSSDATRSYDEAVRALREARVPVLEQRLNYDSYTLVFEVRYGARVERYNSMTYSWSSDLQRAADDFVMTQRRRGMVVLQKNIGRNSFTVSFFDPR